MLLLWSVGVDGRTVMLIGMLAVAIARRLVQGTFRVSRDLFSFGSSFVFGCVAVRWVCAIDCEDAING